MNEFNWSYASNTFEVCTRNNAKKMSILAPDHLSKLTAASSTPAIAAMVAETQPIVNDYGISFSHLTTANNVYRGETGRFTSLLADLSSLKIKQWDIAIQGVFLEGTNEYLSLLPNGRGPFQKGAYEVRIAEVRSLAENLSNFPALSALQLTVDTFYTTLVAARHLQQQKEGLVQTASEVLNVIRIEMANQMYKNLGGLMVIYFQTPLSIERFYDLELIRSHNTPTDEEEIPEPNVGTVAAGGITNVLNGTFTASSVITITNTGTVPLVFYLASSPTADILPPTSPDPVGVLVAAGAISTHLVLEFGVVFTEFLNAKNTATAAIGSYEVVVS